MRNKITESYSLDQDEVVGYFAIPLSIAFDSRLTLVERFVLAHFRMFTVLNRKPCFDSPMEFSVAFNIRESHVKRAYRRLIQKNLLKADRYETPEGTRLGYVSVLNLGGIK